MIGSSFVSLSWRFVHWARSSNVCNFLPLTILGAGDSRWQCYLVSAFALTNIKVLYTAFLANWWVCLCYISTTSQLKPWNLRRVFCSLWAVPANLVRHGKYAQIMLLRNINWSIYGRADGKVEEPVIQRRFPFTGWCEVVIFVISLLFQLGWNFPRPEIFPWFRIYIANLRETREGYLAHCQQSWQASWFRHCTTFHYQTGR